MAKKKPSGGDDKGEKKSKKMLIIALVAVLALGGVGYKMFGPKPKPGPAKPGAIVTMDPTTLNLADGHYLKIGVAIQLIEGKGGGEGGEGATEFPVSHAQELVIDEFTGREVKTLTNENRKKIAHELGKKIKEAYEGEVYTIYVTQFVIQ